jgi:hypothetical protein
MVPTETYHIFPTCDNANYRILESMDLVPLKDTVQNEPIRYLRDLVLNSVSAPLTKRLYAKALDDFLGCRQKTERNTR